MKEAPKHVISWTAGEHGTITSAKVGETDATSGAEFAEGTVITFVVAPEAGYVAKYAIGTGEAVAIADNTFTVTVDEAKTITISFVLAPTETTITKTIAEVATANGWEDATLYPSIDLGDVTINLTATPVGTYGQNTGKYYTNGNEWRTYQNESPAIKIAAKEGLTIVSVKITYAAKNSGVLTNGSENVKSGTVVDVNASSITFGVGNTGTKTNGQVKITAIEIVYQ